MIYIERKTKTKSKVEKLNLDEAVRFIAEFRRYNAKSGSLYIIGSDNNEELAELFRYFVPEMFHREETAPFHSFVVNIEIPEKKRLILSQVTKKSIEKFSKKISEELGIRENNIYYGANFFALTFENDALLFDFVCSYKLEVINSYVRSRNNEFKHSNEDTKKFEQTINRIFVKQRHYYKKKELTK
jgi:hypothetical protein